MSGPVTAFAAHPVELTETVTHPIFDIEAMSPQLDLLREAYNVARSVGGDPWQFAVEIVEMRDRGVTNSILRWLLVRGMIRQGQEVSTAAAAHRHFVPVLNLALHPTSCFILTEAGVQILDEYRGQRYDRKGPATVRPETVPHWDHLRQTLSVGPTVVKQFKVPAPNQELILTAFQEEQWSVHIDDPLPPRDGINPKRRLQETITSLNRSQRQRLVRFHGDGRGRGISWSFF